MSAVLVDTGFLVALFRPSDRLRTAAREFLRDNVHQLATVSAVIVETCFFLDPEGKSRLLEWIDRGALSVADLPVSAYADIRGLILRYADRDIDFADAAMVWFADNSGCRTILTVDRRDFGIYRLAKGRRFELLNWYQV